MRTGVELQKRKIQFWQLFKPKRKAIKRRPRFIIVRFYEKQINLTGRVYCEGERKGQMEKF